MFFSVTEAIHVTSYVGHQFSVKYLVPSFLRFSYQLKVKFMERLKRLGYEIVGSYMDNISVEILFKVPGGGYPLRLHEVNNYFKGFRCKCGCDKCMQIFNLC